MGSSSVGSKPLLFLATMLTTLMISCSLEFNTTDRSDNMIGTWSASCGGTITFYASGSGTDSTDCRKFYMEFGDERVHDFTWSIINDDETLRLRFEDPSGPYFSFREVNIISSRKNEVQLGLGVLYGDVLTLTRQ